MAKDGKGKSKSKDRGKGKGNSQPKPATPSTVVKPVLIGAAVLALLDAVLSKVL